MKERFEGDAGHKRLVTAMQAQKVAAGDKALAEELISRGELIAIPAGEAVITEGASDNDVYFLLAGKLNIIVKGKTVNSRTPGDHVGEMAAIDPSMPRSATVLADQDCVAYKISEEAVTEVAEKYPAVWRNFAKELSARLNQRNLIIQKSNDQPRLFIICSSEALSIANEIQSQLSHHFMVVVWTNGIFFVSGYPLDSLEEAVDESDFAIAIAQADDVTESRGQSEKSVRDNVIFELGLFMGRLGRDRTILLQSAGSGLRLPSDLKGLTTISYKRGNEKDTPALLGPACTEITKHVRKLGVRT